MLPGAQNFIDIMDVCVMYHNFNCKYLIYDELYPVNSCRMYYCSHKMGGPWAIDDTQRMIYICTRCDRYAPSFNIFERVRLK